MLSRVARSAAFASSTLRGANDFPELALPEAAAAEAAAAGSAVKNAIS